ncbi:YbbC/YhhH family protein [Tenacibaculum maritimum]|uniref:YbbC/YhhH family protein n=1 Tax=Tenacibaculum maritimum TaxID=107401 RepID=UPI0012E5FBBA|nr:YbbC/YhhH family protein [Tenacibaculum maritimum]MCD9584389.1 YbbC/YhhH family protein [Tenacibaculum maritimum]MCD9622101.1 YbbC/YhhH family protein [Tenacibaculum maritimum]MCD9627596.1 YbbC/YhhH family protein [Tenacibaculum maritimum]MCD9631456.1 YbbC/YhhH family protein [Tenacibaculum maritimum]MCD9632153.1 YbbC/YhhH family protein [Tenacibaculum maritimum]
MKKIISLLSILVFSLFAFKKETMGTNNYVPNKETAIKIAEAIWLPIYGNKIYKNKPFTANLNGGIWIVEGTLHTDSGGVPYIEIRKEDCKVIDVYHTK